MKRKPVVLLFVAILIVLGTYLSQRDNTTSAPTTNTSNTQTGTKDPGKTTPPVKVFDTSKYSRTDPASIWVVISKSHPLSPKTYVPADLVLPNVKQRVPGTTEMKMRATAAAALEQMFTDAGKDNVKLLISTAYRSYSYQSVLYNNDVKAHGQAAADRSTARPGYSEHQSGLAVDIRAENGVCSVQQCFGTTKEGEWLATNAYNYGFLLRYPSDKEAVTGYEYEPWHFRFIGTDLSKQMHKTGTETLEEFFNVSSSTSYN